MRADQPHQALEKFNRMLQLAQQKQNSKQLLKWIDPILKPGPDLLENENTLNLYECLENVLGSDRAAAESAAQELLTLAEAYQPSTLIQERNKYLAWGSALSIGGALAFIVLFSIPPIQVSAAAGFFIMALGVAFSAAMAGITCLTVAAAMTAVTAEKGPRECIQAIAKSSIKTSAIGESVRLWFSDKKQTVLRKAEGVSAQRTANPEVGL